MSNREYLPAAKFMIAGKMGVAYGDVCEPGHDCNIEDHHTAHSIRVTMIEVAELNNDLNQIHIAIPVESEFFAALMDGSLVDQIEAMRARFESEGNEDSAD